MNVDSYTGSSPAKQNFYTGKDPGYEATFKDNFFGGGGGSNGWAYFGMLYNLATIRGVAIFLRVGIFMRDYLRTIPTLNYTVHRYDCQ